MRPQPGQAVTLGAKERMPSAWSNSQAAYTSSRRSGRPVAFTEIGYRSVAGGVKEPWNWETAGGTDLQLQSEAYRALFDTFWGREWFGGTFIWKWNPYLGAGKRSADTERDFTPQGKPALEVIREYYRMGTSVRR